jgi:hypothetical protein
MGVLPIRFLAAVTLAIVFAAPAAAQTTGPPVSGSIAPGTRVILPGGELISIVVADKISSANANVGDTFAIRAAADVTANGWVVIAKGATGEGEILSVDRAGSHGHPGTLGVQMDWIYAVDGDKVKLTSQRRTEEGQGEAGKSSTITILSWAFLGLPGLFAHNFVKGHDIEIDSTHPLKAYVDDSVYVVATIQGDAAPGFAPAIAAAPATNAVPASPAVGAAAAATAAPPATSSASTQPGMAPPAPSAFAPPVSGAAAPPGAATTIFETEGSGSQTSKSFPVTGAWAIAWSYDCSKAPKSASTFEVDVQGGDAQTPIQPTGPSGIDVTHYHEPGTYYLKIETGCTWHVRVFNES